MQRKIVVGFLSSDLAKWKGQTVYDAIVRSNLFSAVMIVHPTGREFASRASEISHLQQRKCQYFERQGMRVIDMWDSERNVLKEIRQVGIDVLFYEQPWEVPPELCVERAARHVLTFYYPYFVVNNSDVSFEIGEYFHHYLFRHIVLSQEFLRYYKFWMKNMRGFYVNNLVALGHPMLDQIKFNTSDLGNGYVIYAPHWTIDYPGYNTHYHYSTFLKTGEEILTFAENHPEKKWIFKPHPILYSALLESGAMQKEEIDAYYARWGKIGRVCLDASYVELFNESDVLITDCGSFLTEFSLTGRPIIRLVSSKLNVEPHLVVKKLYESYYNVCNKEQLLKTFDEIILNGNDPNRQNRIDCVDNFRDGKTNSAQEILTYLKELLIVK